MNCLLIIPALVGIALIGAVWMIARMEKAHPYISPASLFRGPSDNKVRASRADLEKTVVRNQEFESLVLSKINHLPKKDRKEIIEFIHRNSEAGNG